MQYENFSFYISIFKVDVWRSGTFLEKPQVSEWVADNNHRPQSD